MVSKRSYNFFKHTKHGKMMKQKYMLLKCMSLVIVLSFSTITFGMYNSHNNLNYDFESSVYGCIKHCCQALDCPLNSDDSPDCDGLSPFLFSGNDSYKTRKWKDLFWNTRSWNTRSWNTKKEEEPKKSIRERIRDSNEIYDKEKSDQQNSIRQRIQDSNRAERKRPKKDREREQRKQSYNQSGVDMNTGRKLGLAAAAGVAFAGGTANGMDLLEHIKQIPNGEVIKMKVGLALPTRHFVKAGKLNRSVSLKSGECCLFKKSKVDMLEEYERYKLPRIFALVVPGENLGKHRLPYNAVHLHDFFGKRILSSDRKKWDPSTGVKIDDILYYLIYPIQEKKGSVEVSSSKSKKGKAVNNISSVDFQENGVDDLDFEDSMDEESSGDEDAFYGEKIISADIKNLGILFKYVGDDNDVYEAIKLEGISGKRERTKRMDANDPEQKKSINRGKHVLRYVRALKPIRPSFDALLLLQKTFEKNRKKEQAAGLLRKIFSCDPTEEKDYKIKYAAVTKLIKNYNMPFLQACYVTDPSSDDVRKTRKEILDLCSYIIKTNADSVIGHSSWPPVPTREQVKYVELVKEEIDSKYQAKKAGFGDLLEGMVVGALMKVTGNNKDAKN